MADKEYVIDNPDKPIYTSLYQPIPLYDEEGHPLTDDEGRHRCKLICVNGGASATTANVKAAILLAFTKNRVTIKEVQQELSDTASSLTSSIDNAKQEFTSNINNTKQEFTSSLNSTKQELTSSINTVKTDLTSSINKTKQEFTSSLKSTRQELASSIDTAKADLTSSINKTKQDLTSSIATAKQELTSNINTTKTELTSSINSVSSSLNTTKQELTSSINSVSSNLNTTKQDLSSNISNTKKELVSSINTTKQEILNDVTTKISNVSKNVAGTYIKGLSVSGKTVTYTRGDGTTGTFTTQDTNTTYSAGANITLSGTTFSLTKANVIGALGYTPPTQDTNTTYSKLSQFVNDTGYITSSGSCAYATSAGNGVASYGTGWIRFKSGIQICWGQFDTTSSTTISFAKPFNSEPIVTVSHETITSEPVIATVSTLTATTIGAKLVFPSGNELHGNVQFIAIGTWR